MLLRLRQSSAVRLPGPAKVGALLLGRARPGTAAIPFQIQLFKVQAMFKPCGNIDWGITDWGILIILAYNVWHAIILFLDYPHYQIIYIFVTVVFMENTVIRLPPKYPPHVPQHCWRWFIPTFVVLWLLLLLEGLIISSYFWMITRTSQQSFFLFFSKRNLNFLLFFQNIIAKLSLNLANPY